MSPDERAELEVERTRAFFVGLSAGEVDAVPANPSARDEQILRQILAGGTGRRASQRRVRRRVRWISTAAVGAAAALFVAVGVLGPSGSSPARAQTPKMLSFATSTVEAVANGSAPSARAALLSIASVAAEQPAHSDPTATQQVTSYAWFLNTSAASDGTTTRVLAPTIETTRLAPDGSVDNHERRGPALDTQGRVIDPDQYPLGGGDSVDSLPAGTLDARLPASLPRGTTALRAALLQQMSGQDCSTEAEQAACLYSAVQELYIRWVVPTDLSAAIWTVMAQEPDVRLLGDTTDRVGRPGMAIAVLDPWLSPTNVDVMVISAATGQMLMWEQVALDASTPTVASFQAVTRSELVPTE